MARYVLKVGLSVDSLNRLSRNLDDYAKAILPNKVSTFVEKLAEKGIYTTQYHMHNEFKPYVDFTYKANNRTLTTISGELNAKANTLIHRVWYTPKGEVKDEYDINPLLMSEFGAGAYAPQGWRGSLGENGKKSEWFWYDENGVKHSSEEDDLIVPTYPMHEAYLEMVRKYKDVAKEVFG